MKPTTTTTNKRARIDYLTDEATATAYYHDMYARPAWRGLVRHLVERGYSDVDIVEIMASKIPRWLHDDKTERTGKALVAAFKAGNYEQLFQDIIGRTQPRAN